MEKNTLRVTKDTTVEVNEFGNVSKIKTEEVLAEKQGELEKVFHYRIEKEAGLSTDDETGEYFPIYCHIHIKYENEKKEDTIHFAHAVYYPKQISEEHGIDLAHITPISKETYESETK